VKHQLLFSSGVGSSGGKVKEEAASYELRAACF
jgi:hypothetical protein